MDVSLKSPIHGSPIYRKKLFNKDKDVTVREELTDNARKISKANVDSIKSAGESLPKPVFQTFTQTVILLLLPKVRMQSLPLSNKLLRRMLLPKRNANKNRALRHQWESIYFFT